MNGQQLKELIKIVDEMLGEASYFAHVALHNFNLGDGILDWLINEEIDRLPGDPNVHLSYHPNDIGSLKRFLKWLKTIPEDVRDDVITDDDIAPDVLNQL